jgi:nicotinamide riboside kinase
MVDHDKFRDIYIVGAQCTGKTTVVNALRDHFNSLYEHESDHILRPRIITETARIVLQRHGFTADDITSSPARALALQQLILEAQLSAERAAVEEGRWLISDRSGVDPIVYARKFVGEDAANNLAKSRDWLELRQRMRRSLVIVCEAGADWLTNGGVRLMPESHEDWVSFHLFFCKCLDDWGVEYDILPCNLTNLIDRVMFILEKWKAA